MADLVRTSEGYAPLAQGPLAKPSGLRTPYLNKLKRLPLPFAILSFGVWVAGIYQFEVKRVNEAMEYLRNAKSIQDKEFQEMKEYGIFKSVKASWQLDD